MSCYNDIGLNSFKIHGKAGCRLLMPCLEFSVMVSSRHLGKEVYGVLLPNHRFWGEKVSADFLFAIETHEKDVPIYLGVWVAVLQHRRSHDCISRLFYKSDVYVCYASKFISHITGKDCSFSSNVTLCSEAVGATVISCCQCSTY